MNTFIVTVLLLNVIFLAGLTIIQLYGLYTDTAKKRAEEQQILNGLAKAWHDINEARKEHEKNEDFFKVTGLKDNPASDIQ